MNPKPSKESLLCDGLFLKYHLQVTKFLTKAQSVYRKTIREDYKKCFYSVRVDNMTPRDAYVKRLESPCAAVYVLNKYCGRTGERHGSILR